MKIMKSGRRLWLALTVFVLLMLAGAGVVAAQQVKEPHGWIVAKRLTVETQAYIPTLTADTATFTTLTAPTVTMTSATTWTVASLTATTLQATNGTVTALTASGAAVNGNALITGNLTVSGTSRLVGAVTAGTVGAGALTATGLTVNGSATITGSGNVGGHFDVIDYLSVSGETYLIPPDAFTVVDSGLITPTGTVMELDAAGPVTATMSGCGDGQLVLLVNTSAQTIVVAEDSEARIAGNATLGQYDTLTLLGVGVKCYELARSNN